LRKSKPNGHVLVAGGNFLALREEVYNPAAGNWYAVGRLHTARMHHAAALLPNGKVLVAGGTDFTAAGGYFHLHSAEVFDPATLMWTPIGDLNIARSSHTVTLLPNGKVLVAGGSDATFYAHSLDSAELYDSADSCSTIRVNHPTALPIGTLGTAYWQTFDQVGSTGTVVWGISAGTLPSGLTLDAESGTLSGTPTVLGTSTFTVQATNGNCLGERTYTLVVKGVSTTVLFASPNPVEVGQPLTLAAEVSTPNGEIPTGTVHFSINGLSTVRYETLGTATLDGGVAYLTFTAPAAVIRAAAGERVIRAYYSGDGHFHPSSADLSLTVQSAPPPVE
jgi:hypothetical protein